MKLSNYEFINSPLQLELFCLQLVEEFDEREEAINWLNDNFIPSFESAITISFKQKEGEDE